MIVTGGQLRGRRLHVPPGLKVRPTPARAKEALFSILASRLDGARVLDLFAGSGALGIEALSRGAAWASFTEVDSRTAAALRNTLSAFGITDTQSEVLPIAAERSLARLTGEFNIVFADPPYAQPPPLKLFGMLQEQRKLAPDAVLVYEHAANNVAPEMPGLHILRREHWGEAAMTFYLPDADAARIGASAP